MGKNPSYICRSIMEAQEVIKRGYRKRIGGGKNTKIWHVPWLRCRENGHITSEMQKDLEKVQVCNLFDETEHR